MAPRVQPGPPKAPPPADIPPLQNGDRLTREEFERRYDAMPQLKKAELIEGVVYVPSTVNYQQHGKQTTHLVTWLGNYEVATSGVEAGDNTTVRMDLKNEPQPDAFLRVKPEHGGQSRTTKDGYIEGAPELAAEVAASTASYDLNQKLNAYRRNGVREYVVVRVLDNAIDWFRLRGRKYQRLTPDASGHLRSEVFPGLRLDPAALLRSDLARVLAVLQEGLRNPEHAAFVKRLGEALEPLTK